MSGSEQMATRGNVPASEIKVGRAKKGLWSLRDGDLSASRFQELGVQSAKRRGQMRSMRWGEGAKKLDREERIGVGVRGEHRLKAGTGFPTVHRLATGTRN